MIRTIIASICLSSIMISPAVISPAFGADKPQTTFLHRASVPARLAPVYGFPDLNLDRAPESSSAPTKSPEKVNLRSGAGANPEEIGTTTYDCQHNCSMGRQVEHRVMFQDPPSPYAKFIDFGWTEQQTDVLASGSDRQIGYQVNTTAFCAQYYAVGGIIIPFNFNRAGYVDIDKDTGAYVILAAHEQDAGVYRAEAFWFFFLMGHDYYTPDFPLDNFGWYQNPGTGEGVQNVNIWPKIEWDIDGAEQVLHMVTTESGGAAGDRQTCSYYRRAGPYGLGEGHGTWSDQHVIDTMMNVNVTVASSPVSDRVAIVWNAPVDYKRDTPDEYSNQLENDVWVAIATDNGAAWAAAPTNQGNPSIQYLIEQGTYTGYNITEYSPLSDWKAFCDMSALFSTQDELNIVWGCRRWTDTTAIYRRQSAIFHWKESDPVPSRGRMVVRADWDTGGACFGHAWGSDAAKMTISECDGKLYCLYTQFGQSNNPCGDVDADHNVVNGYLYLSVFDPVYNAWDRPQRVTATPETPAGCIPGDMSGPGTCNNEYWASMARYGRIDTCKTDPEDNVLDILYINDYAPGTCVQPESGVWTVNPVRWLVYPCRDAVPAPDLVIRPPGYGLCIDEPILVAPTTGETEIVFTLENYGTLDNNFTVTAQVDSGGSGATTVEADPTGGTLPAGGGWAEITVTITTAGESENVTVYASLTVTHEGWGSPRTAPICITVTDQYILPGYAVVSTACKRLRIYNTGELSNHLANASLDFIDDPDDCADIYLYDGSPIICRDIGGEIECFFTIFDNNYYADHALRQVTPLLVDSLTNSSYTYVAAEFVTADTAIQLTAEYFVPKHEDSCSFVIQRLRFWNITQAILPGVAVGEVLDWDIPGFDYEIGNESGYDLARRAIYQYCCARDACDTLLDCARYGGIAAWDDLPFKNYMTLENDVFVWMSGPFGSDAPLPRDTMYHLMTTANGFSTAPIDTCEDLTTLVTFGVWDMEPFDTLCYIKILSTSRNDVGGAAFLENIDMANAYVDAHEEIQCEAFVCDCEPGNANADESVNVGDAVYVINFVFKQGPAPVPYAICSGDPNNDGTCNVGDAVFIVNLVFKEGPPPATCDDWVNTYGTPLRK